MSSSPDKAGETMLANLKEKTGKSLDEWVAVVNETGLDKNKAIIDYLKKDHGFTYGYANMVAQETLARRKAAETGRSVAEVDLVAEQYAGDKAALRPIYDALIEKVQAFGEDVEVSPKKTYVSLRRKKQFAILQPSTKTRLDVGINLKDVEPQGRLEASGSFNSMVSHRVRLESQEEINDELVGWLVAAYKES